MNRFLITSDRGGIGPTTLLNAKLSTRLNARCWIVREIAANGDSISSEEKISQFDAVLDAAGGLITSLRTANNRLKLVAWAVTPSTQRIQRLMDSGNQGQPIRQHALMRCADQMMTAVQTASGAFKLIAWAIPASTLLAGQIMHVGESASQSTTGTLSGLCREALDGNAPIMTSEVTAEGMLKLMTWRA